MLHRWHYQVVSWQRTAIKDNMAIVKKKCIWEGIINIGQCVDDDSWFPGSCRYFDGYVARRKILYDDHEYSVDCKIKKSLTNRPLFECVASENEKTFKPILATNPTTAVKKMLQNLGITLLFKNGNSFYGLDRQDVISLQKNVKGTQSEDDLPSHIVNSISSQRQASWFGVVSFGTYNPKYMCNFGGCSFPLQPGYEALRCIKLSNEKEIILHCKLEEENNLILYECFTDEPPIIKCKSYSATSVVKESFGLLGVESKKKWSGHDFFGFMKSEVINVLNSKPKENPSNKKKKAELDPVLKLGMQIRARNAGETSSLKNTKSIKKRNETIHKLVEYVGFGDVISYVTHLCDKYPHIIEESVGNTPNLERQFIERLKISTIPIKLNCSTTAELLIGKCCLSQRGYKNLRKILLKNNISIPTYDAVRKFCLETYVGEIEMIHSSNNEESDVCSCMGIRTNITDTLQQLMNCKKLSSELHFFDGEEQERIFLWLKKLDSELYANLDSSKRTLFLRDTGDNFRAASRYPTEQTSFSLLNLKKFTNNPYGQFITTLWRGLESRQMLFSHCSKHYDQLTELVKNGVSLIIDGKPESFNIVAFFVADLCFIKDIIGLCSSISTYGCFHCLLKRDDWSSLNKKVGKSRCLAEMRNNEPNLVNILGQFPDHSTKQFKQVQLSHHGQWTTNLFQGFTLNLMPPCGLHLILAHHRYLYKFMHDIISKREMESRIPEALRKIGCGFLGYQVDQYFKSKKKSYDGSETLKMIGNDCKIMEANIDTFLYSFLRTGEKWESESCLKLRQVLELYHAFKDLASDIRSTSANKERAESFDARAESYFKKFASFAGSTPIKGLPYFHYLRNHIGSLMVFYADLFKWGYGMFTCNAGEHLNKRIKFSEISQTNMNSRRFYTVTHMMRLKQFIFTDSIIPSTKEIQCSACQQIGHNKKNKMCPMHPSHPPIHFDDTDDEQSDNALE